ncbi:uncharacterized protein LOC142219661 [Haematobia irritans]|uniref:uncharacterized protein LOC142219661 n=1 Tax=Haematobia irritans TaxID=7368 RepID=UPI003F4FDBA5
MKFLVIALFVTLIGATFAVESRGIFKDDAHPGKCVYKDMVLSPGEEGKVKGECERIICNKDNGFATLQGCGAESAPPNCKFGDYINVDAPYGDCCKRHIICS